ncbi:MAG: hypothetical protein JNL62_09985 [Bryobacterales bacterium]|nr:hypothetical protein [Bryobacterales bacterium]
MKRLWRRHRDNPWLKRAWCIAVVALVAYAEYKLIRWPRPIDVSRDRETAVLRANRDLHRLAIRVSAPVEDSRVLYFEGKLDGRPLPDAIDLSFSNARLDKSKLGDLQALHPPLGAGEAEYFTEDAEPGKVSECRHFLEASIAPGAALDLELTQPPSSVRNRRDLDMVIRGTSLLVSSNALPKDEDADPEKTPGCAKVLRIGNWTRRLAGVGVDWIALPGSRVEIRFYAGKTGKEFVDADGMFRMLRMPGLEVEEARLVLTTAGQEAVRRAPIVELRRSADATLRIKELALDSSAVQLALEGVAWTKKNGEDVGALDLLEWIKRAPVIASLVALFDTALLAWVKKQFAPKPKERPVILTV